MEKRLAVVLLIFPPQFLRSRPLCTKSGGSVMIKEVICEKRHLAPTPPSPTSSTTPFPSSSTTLLPFVSHGANANLPAPWRTPPGKVVSAHASPGAPERVQDIPGRVVPPAVPRRMAAARRRSAARTPRALCKVAAAHHGRASRQAQTSSVNATHLKFPPREQLLTCVLIMEWWREKKKRKEKASVQKRTKEQKTRDGTH